jgi:hypothetical protein
MNQQLKDLIQQEAEAYATGMIGIGEYSDKWHHGDKVLFQTIVRAVRHGIHLTQQDPSKYFIQGISRERVAEIIVAFELRKAEPVKGVDYDAEAIKSQFLKWAKSEQGQKLLSGIGDEWVSVEHPAVEILRHLCELKHYKDTVGKDEVYKKRQPETWKMANDYLNSLVPNPPIK